MSKVVVVTGGSAGVGRAAAKAFARRGDRVALLARGADSLNAAAREVADAGGKPLTVRTDVAEHDRFGLDARDLDGLSH